MLLTDNKSGFIDGQAYAWSWPFSVFTPKHVFAIRTAKSQPIWIEFNIHTPVVVRNTIVADLDCDWRVDVSRPNQNDCFFFCNTCNAHDDGSSRFRQQTAKRGGEDGCYREKVRNFVALAEPDPKYSFLAFLGYPSTILHAHKSLYVTSITKSHSRFGLAWSRRGLSRPTSVFLTTIGVCKILSRSVDIGSTMAKTLFLSKNSARPSLCLGLTVKAYKVQRD